MLMETVAAWATADSRTHDMAHRTDLTIISHLTVNEIKPHKTAER